MRKAVATLSAAALACGLAAASPTPAEANPLIIAPAAAAAWLIGGIVGGLVVGNAISNHPVVTPTVVAESPPPPPVVAPAVVEPPAGCHFARARIHHVWRRVQVCDTY